MIKPFFFLLCLIFLPTLFSQSQNCTIPNCLTCSPDPSNLTCLVCEKGFFYDREEEVCSYLLPCPDGEYKNETTGQCFPCSSDCAFCYGPANYQCTTCPKGYWMALMNSLTKCLTCSGQFCDQCDYIGNCISCPDGFWLNATSGNCIPCSVQHCLSCNSDPNDCDNCRFGWVYSNNSKTCKVNSNCQLGTYNDYVKSGICSSCDASCSNCFGPGNGNCYECANGYYFNNESLCLPCNSSCADCEDDAEYCVACKSPLMLRGKDCVQSCAGDEYFDIFEQRCKSCDGMCGSCVGSSTYCLECADLTAYKLVNNTCVPICGSNEYNYMGENQWNAYAQQEMLQFMSDSNLTINNTGTNCKMCSQPCQSCSYLNDFCTACGPGMFLNLLDAYCYPQCPQGTYSKLDLATNISYCLPCSYGCVNCINLTTCTSCVYPFEVENGLCSFNNTEMGVCNDNQFLVGVFCLNECPEGTRAIGHECFCDNSCKKCTYNYLNNFIIDCVNCGNQSLFSYEGKCLQTCPNYTWILDPEYYYPNASPQKHCYDACPQGLLRNVMNGINYCVQKCPTGTKSFSGTCFMTTVCPNGTYYNPIINSTTYDNNQNYTEQDLINLFCIQCDPSCQTCNGPTNYNCLSCPQGGLLQNNQNVSDYDISTSFLTLGLGNAQITQNYMNYFTSLGAFCNNTCPLGQIPFNQMCVLCFNNCSVCEPPLVKFQSNCVYQCPPYSNYSQATNECLFDNSTGGFFLGLYLTNPYIDNYHVGYLTDLVMQLTLESVYNPNTVPYPTINSTNCSLQNLNSPNNSQNLIIRTFDYVFITYSFSVPSKLLQPGKNYSVYCQAQTQNPPFLLNKTVNFATFNVPIGYFDVQPTNGTSLTDSFIVHYWDWHVYESDNMTVTPLLLEFDIWVYYGSESICISQDNSFQPVVDVNKTFMFPYVTNQTSAQISLLASNLYTMQTTSINITINPETSDNVQYMTSSIDFDTITPENLNILIQGFVNQKGNIIQSTDNNLISNNEFLYKSINNQYYYTCVPSTDCNNNGECLSNITDPKHKCICDSGYAGFDCSWNQTDLKNTTILFANVLNYLQNIIGDYSIINNMITNMALFSDAFNLSMLTTAVDLLQNTNLDNQNDTIMKLETLGNLMNVVKILKYNLTNSDLGIITNLIQSSINSAIESVSNSFGQSTMTSLSINNNNIQVKLQSLSFLGQLPSQHGNNNNPIKKKSNPPNNNNNPPNNNRFLDASTNASISSLLTVIPSSFTIALNDSLDPTNSPGVDLNLGPSSFAFLSYYCDEFFVKMVILSSSVLKELNSTSRYFTNILSFEIKNRSDYSDYQPFNDSEFNLRIPKIANISSTASGVAQGSSLFTCLYYDNSSANWNETGLEFSMEAIDFIECNSTHLTDFSVQLVENSDLIYDFFQATCNPCFDSPPPGVHRLKFDLGLMTGIYLVISLLLVWMVCSMHRKTYSPVSRKDSTSTVGIPRELREPGEIRQSHSGEIREINPVQMMVRGDGEKGVVIVDPTVVNMENAKEVPSSTYQSGKSSQVFAEQRIPNPSYEQSPNNLRKPNSPLSFHPLYSIYMKNHDVPLFRKLIQLHFSMSFILALQGLLLPLFVGGIPLVLISCWVANYVFGCIIHKLMNSRPLFSIWGKTFGVFLYFFGFFVLVLAVAFITDALSTLILSLICYFLDWVFFDVLVVVIVACGSSSARSWFSFRGFSK